MVVRQTSLDALTHIERRGSKATQEQQILGLLRCHPEGLTINQIARQLGLYPSTVSARLNGLKDQLFPLVTTKGQRVDGGWVDLKRKDVYTGINGLVWFAVER